MKIIIKNGNIIDPLQNLDIKGWILVDNGKISDFGEGNPKNDFNADEVIDAENLVVSPGFIDLHVHLREPGGEGQETIETGSRAAVAGGFTSIVCMPNTTPPVDHASTVKFINLEANRVNLANVFPTGTISRKREGKELADIGELVQAGVVAITDDGSPVEDACLMRTALEYSKMFPIPIMEHCEELQLKNEGVMNEGFFSTKLGLRGIPSACEDVMIARNVILAKYTGGRLHISHLSTKNGTQIIRDAKNQGVNVTCEVTPHHLTLTDEALSDFDTNFKMNPPLRTESDRQALAEGLVDGTIDAIATDHAPHTITSKNVEFDYAPDGVIGLETALPAVFTKLVKEDKIISLSQLIELLSTKPAKIINQKNKGSLKKGADADITLFDIKSQYSIDSEKFFSKSRNCPFNGNKVYGKVVQTIVAGKTKFETGKIGN